MDLQPTAVNCSLVYADLSPPERVRAAAAAGFTAVEFWWPFATATPDPAEVDVFVGSLADAGVALVALNLFAGDLAAGDRGILSWPGREAELRASAEIAVEIGRRTGARVFNALYGNRIPGVDPATQAEVALTNLRVAAAAAAAIGGHVVLEAVSGAEQYPLRTAADVVAVLDQAQRAGIRSGLGMLADLYHLAVNGDDVAAVLAAHAGRIVHVQVADAPGRHEPGTGELPLEDWLGRLAGHGYRGHVALECVPSAPGAVTARRSQARDGVAAGGAA